MNISTLFQPHLYQGGVCVCVKKNPQHFLNFNLVILETQGVNPNITFKMSVSAATNMFSMSKTMSYFILSVNIEELHLQIL